MLRESFRVVLKPGGKIRIVTPDLEFYLGLFGGKRGTCSHFDPLSSHRRMA
jgi:predicted SAM-dependent methyltransferase